MTDDRFADATDGADDERFHDEIRQMLQRRAADVPDDGMVPRIAPISGAERDGVGAGVGHVDGVGPAEVLALPERDLGLRTVETVTRGLPDRGRQVPWTRRLPLVAAAAAVLVVAAVGLLSLRDDAQPVLVGPAEQAGGGGLMLLPPEGDEVEVLTLTVTDAESFLEPGAVMAGYGPDETMATDGLTVITELADRSSELGLEVDGLTRVSAGQDRVLAERDAALGDGRLFWTEPADGENPELVVNLFWYGSELSSDDVLAIAGGLVRSPDLVVDDRDLPEGWELRTGLDADSPVTDSLQADLGGAFEGFVISGGSPLPVGLVGAAMTGDPAASQRVTIRGVAGTLVSMPSGETDPADIGTFLVVWQEGGSTHQVFGFARADDVLALAERLVPVDRATAEQRRDSLGALSERAANSMTTTTTMIRAPETTVGPNETDQPADLEPPVSMTAPGPGDVAGSNGATATTGPTTATTIPPATDTPATVPTPPAPPTTPPEPTVPVRRPDGSFTDNSIVPVDTVEFGGADYEMGVSWSPRFGLCVGIDLDGDLTGGGYPVECETEPWVGFGGRREVPGVGTIAFAATADHPDLASARLIIRGEPVEATIERVDAFPDLVFLVFPLEGIPVEEIDRKNLPGDIALSDADGQPIGWG